MKKLQKEQITEFIRSNSYFFHIKYFPSANLENGNEREKYVQFLVFPFLLLYFWANFFAVAPAAAAWF